MSLRLIDGLPAIILIITVLSLYTIRKTGFPITIVAIALFGHPTFFLIKKHTGISATGTTTILLLIILITALSSGLSNKLKRLPTSLPLYSLWALSLFIIVTLGYARGPLSDYSLFSIKYFFIYTSFFIAAGLIVIENKIQINDLILISVFLFSSLYPLLDVSILNIAHMGSAHYGLRSLEDFGAINHGRLSGLLVTLLILAILTTRKNYKNLPEIIIGLAVGLPILWYSNTRQALIASLAVIIVVLYDISRNNNFNKTRLQRIMVLISCIIIIISFVMFIFWSTTQDAPSRIIEKGLESRKRLIHLADAWHFIKIRPFSGWGLGGFNDLGLGPYPHNWFLESWFEYGIIGFFLFIIGTTIVLRPILFSSDHWTASWACLAFYWLVVIQVSSNIPRNSLIFLFITIIGCRKALANNASSSFRKI